MKTRMALALVLLWFVIPVKSQIQATLLFTSTYANTHRPLDSVYVQNLTRGGDTVLYGNDTVLVLDYSIGMADKDRDAGDDILLGPPVPNPFVGSTTISVLNPGNQPLKLRAFNVLGSEVARFSGTVEPGVHHFVFTAGSDSWYLLVAESGDRKSVRKLISMAGYPGECRIEHSGLQGAEQIHLKTSRGGFEWVPGDTLRFIGFAMIDAVIRGHEIISDEPWASKTYLFPLIEGIPCMERLFVKDFDGNIYRTVQIGGQCWLRENLAVSNLNDGTPLTYISFNTSWPGFGTPAFAWYMNNVTQYGDVYGALYNWNAVSTGKLCPSGWHVPSNEEWMILTSQFGVEGVAGGAMKEAGTDHWHAPNVSGTNSKGFTAIPGGYRSASTGSFNSIGKNGSWWSTSEFSTSTAWIRSLANLNICVDRIFESKSSGFSVRCLRNDTASLPLLPKAYFNETTTHTTVQKTVIFTDTSFGIPTSWRWFFGDGDSSTLKHPSHVYQTPGVYTVTLIITNAHGSDTLVKPNLMTIDPAYFVYDVDANPYDTVHIGNQIWLKQNLRTTRYNDGVTYIPQVQGHSQWESLNTGARCYYNNDSASYAATYGALYNFFAVDTGMLCPTGWHVPSQAEWDTLINFLGGTAVAGGLLKDTGFTFWNTPNTGATNQTGFTALASGYRNYSSTQTFYQLGYATNFWTSTAVWAEPAYYFTLSFNSSQALLNWYSKRMGNAVRCLQN
ncbi:MAG: FISUMP domain-containing protein [Bacteroidales bacterium]